jgi:hypothetical protein
MPASTFACGAIAAQRQHGAHFLHHLFGVLRTLASECASLAETGMVSLWAPARKAASAPLRLGTSAITVQPGKVMAWRTTSAASAICGSSFAGTKEATSISRRPAACSA